MRALCGSIITAGALIGLGLTSLGVGTRYQNYVFRNAAGDVMRDDQGRLMWVHFKEMDTTLMIIVITLVLATLVGMAISFMGLAYHHHRRHREWLREMGNVSSSPSSSPAHSHLS